MKKYIWIITLCILVGISASPVRAAENIDGHGDLAFTGFNADGNGDLAFALLADAPGSFQIRFTDNQWSGSAFASGEGEIVWQAPVSGLNCGAVVVISNIHSSPSIDSHLGSVSKVGNFEIDGNEETIYAFLGTLDSPTAFLSAISNTVVSGATVELSGTNLVAGDVVIIGGENDIMAYDGPRHNLNTTSEYRAQINNPSYWVMQDGDGDQDNDSINPDTPFSSTWFKTPTAIGLTIFAAQTPIYYGLLAGVLCIVVFAGYFLVKKSR